MIFTSFPSHFQRKHFPQGIHSRIHEPMPWYHVLSSKPSIHSGKEKKKKKNPKYSIKKLKGRPEIGVSLLVPTGPSLLVPSASREHMDCMFKGTGKSATLLYMDKGQIRARTAKAQ